MSKVSFDSLFGNTKIDMKCPKCTYKLKITLNDIGSTITCPNCSNSIYLQDDNKSVHTSKRNIDKSLKELEKTFKKFGR